MQPKLELVHDTQNLIVNNAFPVIKERSRRAWLAAVLDDKERIELKTNQVFGENILANSRVLMLGFSAKTLADMRQILRRTGVVATASASNVRQLYDIPDTGLGFTHVIVNLDAFEDIDTAVDMLMDFRKRAHDVVVVACSEAVGGDDFGSERARICDATLKLPVTVSRLATGLTAASHNHTENRRSWQPDLDHGH